MMVEQVTEHEIAMRSWSILNPGATQQQYRMATIEVSRLIASGRTGLTGWPIE